MTGRLLVPCVSNGPHTFYWYRIYYISTTYRIESSVCPPETVLRD
jgi:hypothetical protein